MSSWKWLWSIVSLGTDDSSKRGWRVGTLFALQIIPVILFTSVVHFVVWFVFLRRYFYLLLNTIIYRHNYNTWCHCWWKPRQSSIFITMHDDLNWFELCPSTKAIKCELVICENCGKLPSLPFNYILWLGRWWQKLQTN